MNEQPKPTVLTTYFFLFLGIHFLHPKQLHPYDGNIVNKISHIYSDLFVDNFLLKKMNIR